MDAAGALDSIEEAREGEAGHIADESLNVASEEVGVLSAGLHLFEVVLLNNSGGEASNNLNDLTASDGESRSGKAS